MKHTHAIDKCGRSAAQPEPARSGNTYLPSVDIVELKDELLLRADVPGASSDCVEIRYERGTLDIFAPVTPREAKDRHVVTREYGVGDFARSFEIGDGIDAEKISAELSDGVLTVHLPKAAAARVRKIAVRSN
ncbi:MAG: Hsp20/alpha crystallin family protein [Phycisphaerae bacterium]